MGIARGVGTGVVAALVAGLLLGGPSVHRAAAAPTPPAAAAPAPGSSGCGTGDPARLTGVLRSGGLDRSYLVHLPEGYDRRRPYPLLLAFHGRGEQNAGLRAYAGLDAADAVVVYPQGRTTPPRPGTGPAPAWEGTRDLPVDGVDVRFTRDLVAEVSRRTCVDPRRVVATGASQGGGFTHVLACNAPGTVAAIAPVSGAFYRPTTGGVRDCRSGPLRVLEVHGDADAVITYTGTERSLPIPEWLAGWAGRDRCPGPPAVRPVTPDVSEQRWARCAPGSELVHFLVRGGGHTWPGGPLPAALIEDGARVSPFSATTAMLAFFGIPRTPPPAPPRPPGPPRPPAPQRPQP